MLTSAIAKSARPLSAHSPVFERGYQEFLAHVFEHKPSSVTREEAPAYRAIVLAGCVRIVCNKKTGVLRTEHRVFAPDNLGGPADAKWAPRPDFPIDHFWARRSDMLRAVQTAWVRQVARFIPSVNECYPGPVPAKFQEDLMTRQHVWDMYVSLAADRRLGGRDTRDQAINVFIGSLWNFLVDRETLRLCHAYFGRKATFKDYNLTVRFRAELAQREVETPALAPLMGLYLKSGLGSLLEAKELGQDLVVAARRHFFGVPASASLECDNNLRRRDAQVRLLRPETMSPAAWRFFANQSRHTVASLLRPIRLNLEDLSSDGEIAPRFAAGLNVIVRMGEQPPFSFLNWCLENLLQLYAARPDDRAREGEIENLVRFLRQAARQATLERKRGTLKHFLKSGLLLAWDWLRQREDGVRRREPRPLATVPKNATWASIMRTQQEWHAQRRERERARLEADRAAFEAHQARQAAKTWDSALGPQVIQGVKVVPLTVGQELHDEGARMDHCVGGYVDDCAAGRSRIFSLHDGYTFSTLELALSHGRDWIVSQVFGYDNADVSKDIQKIAKEVAKRYQQNYIKRVPAGAAK